MIVNPLSTPVAPHLAATSSHSAAAANSSSGSTTPNSAANDAESAFMSLLVTELQSQDPTSPMDPTQMVGQMLSMNQLNELVAINETLQNAFGSSTSAPATATSQMISPATTSLTGAH